MHCGSTIGADRQQVAACNLWLSDGWSGVHSAACMSLCCSVACGTGCSWQHCSAAVAQGREPDAHGVLEHTAQPVLNPVCLSVEGALLSVGALWWYVCPVVPFVSCVVVLGLPPHHGAYRTAVCTTQVCHWQDY